MYIKFSSCKRTCKENKKFIHRVISHYNKKGWWGIYLGTGKTNLKILAKEFKRKKT